MSPKQIKRLQIFIILFLSCLTLYVLFKEGKKGTVDFSKNPDSQISQRQAVDSAPKKPARLKTVAITRKLSDKQNSALNKFRQQAQDILNKLPYKSDLQQLGDGQAHSIPQELLQTGRELGKLKELVIMYPSFSELQEEAKTFYKDCADEEEYPTSIRSLCLFNRLQLAKNHNEDFDISAYPLEIKRLVLELAPFKRP